MNVDREGLGKIGFFIRTVKGGWRAVIRSLAARTLGKGGDVLADGAGNSGKEGKLAKDQFGNKTTRHDCHELPGGEKGRSYYQHNNGGTSHVFYSSPFLALTYVCQYGDNSLTQTLDFFNPWQGMMDIDELINSSGDDEK
jgi:hypothetical protein